jgi:hypothetical protein
MTYDRESAVNYAHAWAMRRNPKYYDYDKIGGDCTNFVSQCLFAGFGVMDYMGDGWYYTDANNKSPSWTGVEFLYNYLTRPGGGNGPRATLTTPDRLVPGDIIQLSFDGKSFSHSQFVVETDGTGDAGKILIATHSYDSDYRPLSTYQFEAARALAVVG